MNVAASLRRRSMLDRLEQLLVDAERFQTLAWDAGELDEAVEWYTLAAALRGTLAMLDSGRHE